MENIIFNNIQIKRNYSNKISLGNVLELCVLISIILNNVTFSNSVISYSDLLSI
jgi:hypothetical protein